MAATADLTLAEIANEIIDTDVKTYVAAMDALPNTSGTAEFLAKVLQGAAIAQAKKNAANTTATTGELLNSYPLPTTGTIQTDLSSGLQSFTSVYQLSVVSAAGISATVPAYA
ncbi:hypothetical protein [Nostoc sp. DSM 114167]|jgi:hypothetical protein|uniref:hypothetical protein n=1 Tax=Nostoc sp. DSM 114167 TaxID=3439050 RepID=UPI0040462823